MTASQLILRFRCKFFKGYGMVHRMVTATTALLEQFSPCETLELDQPCQDVGEENLARYALKTPIYKAGTLWPEKAKLHTGLSALEDTAGALSFRLTACLP